MTDLQTRAEAAADIVDRLRSDYGGRLGLMADSAATEIEALRAQLAASEAREMAWMARWEQSNQNWTQNAVDAQKKGDYELSVTIQNTVLTALSGFPVEESRAALASIHG